MGYPGSDKPVTHVAELSKIRGRGLVQLIITRLVPFTFYFFMNGEPIADVDLEDLVIQLADPTPEFPKGEVTSSLTYKAPDLKGYRVSQTVSLFPCTFELNVCGHYLAVTNAEKGNLDATWVEVGLNEDGTRNELSGLKSLKIFLSAGIIDVKVEYDDGKTESLFDSQPVIVN